MPQGIKTNERIRNQPFFADKLLVQVAGLCSVGPEKLPEENKPVCNVKSLTAKLNGDKGVRNRSNKSKFRKCFFFMILIIAIKLFF